LPTPLAVDIHTPAHIRTRYLRGGCWAFAQELSRALKLPVWGIYEGDAGGDCHHAFVADPVRKIGFDIRGTLPFAEIARGSAVRAPFLAPLPEAQLLQIVGSFDPAELKEARRVIRTLLKVDHLESEKSRPEPEDPSFSP